VLVQFCAVTIIVLMWAVVRLQFDCNMLFA